MVKYYSAIAFGVAAGLLIGVAGQKHMNAMATDTCNSMPNYHRLITMRSWLGDAKHCMHIRYLGQGLNHLNQMMILYLMEQVLALLVWAL